MLPVLLCVRTRNPQLGMRPSLYKGTRWQGREEEYVENVHPLRCFGDKEEDLGYLYPSLGMLEVPYAAHPMPPFTIGTDPFKIGQKNKHSTNITAWVEFPLKIFDAESHTQLHISTPGDFDRPVGINVDYKYPASYARDVFCRIEVRYTLKTETKVSGKKETYTTSVIVDPNEAYFKCSEDEDLPCHPFVFSDQMNKKLNFSGGSKRDRANRRLHRLLANSSQAGLRTRTTVTGSSPRSTGGASRTDLI